MIKRLRSSFGVLICGLLFFFLIAGDSAQAQYESSILYKSEGRLIYISDEEGNRIPDFSHAGYKGGGVPLPYPPVKITVSPAEGDDTEQIQDALDIVGEMPMDANGHRGAVLLKPGTYQLFEKLKIRKSGVVLRGSGSGTDPASNTVLVVSDSVRGNVLTIGNPEVNWHSDVEGTLTEVASEFVPVGSRNFEVADGTHFHVGDNIVLRHRSSKKWIDAILGGETETSPPWEPGYIEIYFNRTVTGKAGNTLSIDAPIFNHLDRSLSNTQVYKLQNDKVVTNAGVEYLRIDINTSHPTDDTHAENGIMFEGAEHSWAKHVTVLHFSVTGIGTKNSKNITIQDSYAIEPHSPLTGERRYNFNASHFSNNILFDRVTSSNGRRSFVSNGTSVASGIVFLDSRSVGALNSSEGHQKWSQGLLYDNITFEEPQTYFVLGLHNRGDLGSSHGWGAVHSVAWNVDAGGQYIFIQKPPTAQNYGIGNKGNVSGEGLFEHPAGFIEGTGSVPSLVSLYKAQIEERRNYGVPPDAPARLTVSNQHKNQLQLNWLHSSVKPVKFIIERSEDGGKSFKQIDITQENDSLYIDKTVAEKSYHYRVQAEGANSKSAYSNSASGRATFTIDYLSDFDLNLPENETEISIESIPDDLLVFEWEPIETPLEIEYSWVLAGTNGDFSKPIAILPTHSNREFSVTYRKMINLLDDAGITFDSEFLVKWTIRAQSKTLEKWAAGPYIIRLVKNEDSEILSEDEGKDDEEANKETKLSQNYPNPFNPATTIRFYLAEESNVSLEIFDLAGTQVATVESGMKERGYHMVTFDGSSLASGVYMYRLKTKNLETTRKMTLIK